MVEYEQFYEILNKYTKKIGLDCQSEDLCPKLVQHFSVSSREAPRKEFVKIYDPQTEKINLMNLIDG